MTQEKWVVEIEGTKYHILATDMTDALEQAVKLGAVKVYKYQESVSEMEPMTETQPVQDPNRDYLNSCIDKEVIESLTDTELFDAIDRINKELDYRRTDFLTIPDYCGLIKEK